MNAGLQVDGYDDGIDLGAVVRRIWARRWWALAITVICAAGAVAAAFTITPVYRAATVLVPVKTEGGGLGGSLGSTLGSLGGLASLAGINLGSGGSQTDEALAVLRSRQFTEKFIADFDLLPVLFASRWDAGKGAWKGRANRVPTPGEGFKYFDRSVRSITNDRKTGLVTLAIDWRDREQAAAWANELVRRINAEMRARAVSKADAHLGFLRRELAATDVVDTREAINRLIEAQINQRMLANANLEYAFRVADPALAPDARDVVRPKKAMLALTGLGVGFIVGCAVAYFLASPHQRVPANRR